MEALMDAAAVMLFADKIPTNVALLPPAIKPETVNEPALNMLVTVADIAVSDVFARMFAEVITPTVSAGADSGADEVIPTAVTAPLNTAVPPSVETADNADAVRLVTTALASEVLVAVSATAVTELAVK